MVITLTPDLEQLLNQLAEQQGTTVEILALNVIRERFLPRRKIPKQHIKTLADRLAPYIGSISSREFVPGGANMSVDSGKKFAQGLLEKRKQGRL